MDDYNKGKLTEEEFLALLVNATEEPKDVVLAVYSKLKLKTNIKLIGSTISSVKKLKEQGYKVFVLASTGAGMADTVHYIIDDSLFDGVILSCEAKKLIPEESAYNFILNKWKIKSDETLLVDNDVKNITPFLRMRGYTLLFDTAKASEENKRVCDYVYKINKVNK